MIYKLYSPSQTNLPCLSSVWPGDTSDSQNSNGNQTDVFLLSEIIYDNL